MLLHGRAGRLELPEFLLSLDIGTSALKAGAFDLNGNQIAHRATDYPIARPHPNWAEQNPNDWWNACSQAVHSLVNALDSPCFQAICVTGLAPSLVCVPADGSPPPPAPIWCDYRSLAEAAELRERSGRRAAGILAHALWMKRNQPEQYRRIRWMLESYEYISYRLTGEAAAFTLGRAVAPDLNVLGLDADKFPSRICPPGTVAGAVCATAANDLGIPKGIPVIAGTVDAFCAWIGTAAFDPGIACQTIGSSQTLAVPWDRQPPPATATVGLVPQVATSGWMLAGASASGGSFISWFSRQFYSGIADPWEALMRDAAEIAPGADGLIALPYLLGERSPPGPDSRAVFFGVSVQHTRGHFARAVLESIAFAARKLLDELVQAGARVDEVRLAGPLGRNSVLTQILADVLLRPVAVPANPHSSLLGAAILAGSGAGLYSGIESQARQAGRMAAVVRPVAARTERYELSFRIYQTLCVQLRDVFVQRSQLFGQSA